MQQVRFPAWLRELMADNVGFQAYTHGLDNGREATPRSWLYEDETTDWVFDSWRSKLLSYQGPFKTQILNFEQGQIEKIGPQGYIAPIGSLLADIVYPTFTAHSRPLYLSVNRLRRDWGKACNILIHELKDARLTDLYPENFINVLQTNSADGKLFSNSGIPEFTRRSKPDVIGSSLDDARSLNCERYPAIALFRNYNNKTRLVWMFPFSLNILEASFTQPLQKYLEATGLKYFNPWRTFTDVKRHITEVYSNKNISLVATDFSATDEHFDVYNVRAVDTVLWSLFKDKRNNAGLTVFQSLYWVNAIPLIIGPNSMLIGPHGVASGSNWTNLIETLFDCVFGHYVEQHIHKIKLEYAIGDDMLWSIPRAEVGDPLAKRLAIEGNSVGQQLKAEKVTVKPDEVKTLQRLFIRGFLDDDGLVRGIYPTMRALKSLVFPERRYRKKDWDSDKFCVRCFQIMENCKDHPLFVDFVRFVVKGSHYLPAFARMKAKDIDKAQRKAAKLKDLVPTYNQESRESKLSEYASIKIAKLLN